MKIRIKIDETPVPVKTLKVGDMYVNSLKLITNIKRITGIEDGKFLARFMPCFTGEFPTDDIGYIDQRDTVYRVTEWERIQS